MCLGEVELTTFWFYIKVPDDLEYRQSNSFITNIRLKRTPSYNEQIEHTWLIEVILMAYLVDKGHFKGVFTQL